MRAGGDRERAAGQRAGRRQAVDRLGASLQPRVAKGEREDGERPGPCAGGGRSREDAEVARGDREVVGVVLADDGRDGLLRRVLVEEGGQRGPARHRPGGRDGVRHLARADHQVGGEPAREGAAVRALPERQGERGRQGLGAALGRVAGDRRDVAGPAEAWVGLEALQLGGVARALGEGQGLRAGRGEGGGQADARRDQRADHDLDAAGERLDLGVAEVGAARGPRGARREGRLHGADRLDLVGLRRPPDDAARQEHRHRERRRRELQARVPEAQQTTASDDLVLLVSSVSSTCARSSTAAT